MSATPHCVVFFVLFICMVLREEGLSGAVTASTRTWWGCAGTEAAGHMGIGLQRLESQ